eukprot:s8301_g4.t1
MIALSFLWRVETGAFWSNRALPQVRIGAPERRSSAELGNPKTGLKHQGRQGRQGSRGRDRRAGAAALSALSSRQSRFSAAT